MMPNIARVEASCRRCRQGACVLLAGALLATAGPAQPETPPLRPSLSGILLVAAERMADPRFKRSVVLLLHHDAGGAFGVVLNRPTSMRLGEVAPELVDVPLGGQRLHWGGPVSPQQLGLLVLSQDSDLGQPVTDELRFVMDAGDFDTLARRLRSEQSARVVFGYAGWGPDQLEGELERRDWHLTSPDAARLFAQPVESLWRELIDRVQPREPPGEVARAMPAVSMP